MLLPDGKTCLFGTAKFVVVVVAVRGGYPCVLVVPVCAGCACPVCGALVQVLYVCLVVLPGMYGGVDELDEWLVSLLITMMWHYYWFYSRF
jgi:hypothetical protein